MEKVSEAQSIESFPLDVGEGGRYSAQGKMRDGEANTVASTGGNQVSMRAGRGTPASIGERTPPPFS